MDEMRIILLFFATNPPPATMPQASRLFVVAEIVTNNIISPS